MGTINQRVNVTFSNSELEAIKVYAEATDKSLSQAVAKLALRSLEELDDILMGEKALSRMRQCNSDSWLSMDDFKKALHEPSE